MSESIFSRFGIGRSSDLVAPECLALLAEMEAEQTRFLGKETAFRSRSYPWPTDALHSWSRIWEYPYTLHHLRMLRRNLGPDGPLLVADIGSGVTFFPLLVAKSGMQVHCIDVDPVVAHDLPLAAAALGVSGIQAMTCEGNNLPLLDASMDAVYCVSVLEHIPEFEITIREIARILKPTGKLILTIDLDLHGNSEIGPARHRDLLAALGGSFDPVFERDQIHPGDMLTSANGRYQLYPTGWRFLALMARQVVKPLLGRPMVKVWNRFARVELAVEGSVWIRR